MEDYNKSNDQLIVELKQLRQKVNKIENDAIVLRYNKFISNTKDHISFIDSNYLYFDVNQTYLKTHKLKREDIVGKFVKDIFGKKIFISYIKENIDKCLTGEVIKYQKWFNFPKNKRRYMDVAFYPFYDKNNIILGIMVSSHDITELKLKEELLADREQRYQALIENIPGMVYMGIQDWTKEIVGGAEEICAYSDKELRTGQLEWIDIIHPDDKERILLETEKLFKKAQSKVCVYRIITKQGQIRWVEDRMTSFFYEQEGNYRIDGIVLDISERKKNEEVLKKSEERFRNLFTRIPIGLYRSSLDGRIIEVNPAMVKMLGYPNREALLDTNVSDIFVDYKIRQQKMDSFDQGTTVSNNTFQLYCYDRKIITVQDIASCVKNTKGKILYFEGSLEEITDRIKAQQALKESEVKFKAISNSANDGIIVLDNSGKIAFWNNAAEKIFGYTKNEIIGKNLYSMLIPVKYKDAHIKAFTAFRTTGKGNVINKTVELEALRKNGETFSVELSLSAIKIKDKWNAVGIVKDITERKKAEQKLQKIKEKTEESEKKFRELFEKSGDAILIIENEKFVDCNQATVAMLKYDTKEEFLDTHPSKVSPEMQPDGRKSLEKANKMMETALIKGTHRFEWEHVKNSGEIFPVEVLLTAISNNPEKRIIHTVWRDITNRKKDEEILKESEQKLRELNATKDKFFSIIAHDLKSPFNTMFGFAELLYENFDDYNPEKQKELISYILRDIKNTYKLLENLLLWSSSQGGKIKFKPEKENLYLLLTETIELLNQTADEKSIIIINEIPENIVINVDKDMLATVIRNLMLNAIKFTPKGGIIEIGCDIIPVGTDVPDGTSQQTIQIYVKDTGIGIPYELQETIFDIAEGTSTIGTKGETGTGLGLILCKEFIEKHDGKIWVESEVGKGSKFVFTLPDTL